MSPSFERSAMRAAAALCASALLAAGCNGVHGPEENGEHRSDAAAGAARTSVRDVSAPASVAAPGVRARELQNPDDSTLVFLYYDLAGVTPPIKDWVEQDARVRAAPALDKAARRAALVAELQAAAVAVRGVGLLRLSMDANLSDYDPTYGEFTVRALSPSSVVRFDAFGQQIAVNFGNGGTAQIWRVPADEAQGVRDKLAFGRATLDVLLRITAVQPRPGGGALTTEVLEYELRDARTGTTLARP